MCRIILYYITLRSKCCLTCTIKSQVWHICRRPDKNTSQSNNTTCQHRRSHTEKGENAYKQFFPKSVHSGFLNIPSCVLCTKYKDLSVYSEAHTQGGISFFLSIFFFNLFFNAQLQLKQARTRVRVGYWTHVSGYLPTICYFYATCSLISVVKEQISLSSVSSVPFSVLPKQVSSMILTSVFFASTTVSCFHPDCFSPYCHTLFIVIPY